jgi:hypothetical protein
MSTCQQCRTPNPAGARFCAACASPLSAAPTPFGYAAGVGGVPPAGYVPPVRVPTRDAPLELWLDGLVTFDGSVVEQFHSRANFCGRRHVAVIGEILFHDDGDLTYLDLRTVFRSMNLLIPFRAQQRPQAQQLVAAIRAAKRPL